MVSRWKLETWRPVYAAYYTWQLAPSLTNYDSALSIINHEGSWIVGPFSKSSWHPIRQLQQMTLIDVGVLWSTLVNKIWGRHRGHYLQSPFPSLLYHLLVGSKIIFLLLVPSPNPPPKVSLWTSSKGIWTKCALPHQNWLNARGVVQYYLTADWNHFYYPSQQKEGKH